MRTTEITLDGKTYPMHYSALVMMHIEDRGETVTEALDKIIDGNMHEKMFLLDEMMQAAYQYNKNKGVETPEPPDHAQLANAIGPDEWEHVNEQIINAIKVDPKVEVDTTKKEKGAPQAE